MTHLRISGARLLLAAAAAALLPLPLAAEEEDQESRQDQVVTDDSVDAVDVAATPIQDLNLSKDEIPPLLLEAQKAPYSTEGLTICRHYQVEVVKLDAVLGPDFDIAEAEERRLTAGRVAKSLVGALIPFRGVIREVSGANEHERDFQDAILAGVMRRAFLKGMGLKEGCAYPARPATEEDKERLAKIAQTEAAKAAAEAAAEAGEPEGAAVED